MAANTTTQESGITAQTAESFLQSSLGRNRDSVLAGQLVYNDLDTVPVRQVDLLEQLVKNISALSRIRAMLQFMNKEIRYLIKG